MNEHSTWILTWYAIYKGFAVCQNLQHAHLQDIGVTQIPTYHVSGMAFGWESRTLTMTWSRPLSSRMKWPLCAYIHVQCTLHLQKICATQIPIDHDSNMTFGWKSKTLTITWSRPLGPCVEWPLVCQFHVPILYTPNPASAEEYY
jgi:hypothetical protein